MNLNNVKRLINSLAYAGALLLIASVASGRDHSGTMSSLLTTSSQLAANSKQKADQPKTKAKKKKSPEKQNSTKPKSSKEAVGKAKAQAKGTTTKALSAQTAPTKSQVQKAKSSPKASDEVTNQEMLTFFLILSIFPITSFCVFCYLLWKEFQPTVYPSGKTYAAHDYLPASKGGAFTLEYSADPLDQWDNCDDMTQIRSHQEPAPVTVTREPLHIKESA